MVNPHGVDSRFNTREVSRVGDLPIGPKTTFIREFRNGRGEGRMHTPGVGEEVAAVGGHRVVAVDDPFQRRHIYGLGVRSLAHLRQLLWIPEQEQSLRGGRYGERVGERKLPGLVDHDQV